MKNSFTKKAKRGLALICCLVMVLCLFPASAFAATGSPIIINYAFYENNKGHAGTLAIAAYFADVIDVQHRAQPTPVGTSYTVASDVEFATSYLPADLTAYGMALREVRVGGTAVATVNIASMANSVTSGWTRTAITPIIYSYDILYYQVTFNGGLGMVYDDWGNGAAKTVARVYPGDKLPEPRYQPTRIGYEFTGWYKDAGCTELWDFDTVVTLPMTLYAGWETGTYFTINYIVDGVVYGPLTVPKGARLTGAFAPPAIPPKEGYTFDGWYYTENGNENKWDFTDPNFVVYYNSYDLVAKFTPKEYTVTFNGNGGTPASTTAKVKHGELLPLTGDPTKVGYDFTGWYEDEESKYQWNPARAVTGEMTLFAGWALTPPVPPTVYDVTFDGNGGTPGETVVPVIEGAQVVKPATDPKLDGSIFYGWYDPAVSPPELFKFDTPITGALTLMAWWTDVPPLTVTFNSNGGGQPSETVEVPYGEIVPESSVPSWIRDGYILEGWYKDPACTFRYGFLGVSAPEDKIKENSTLYAKWVRVSYNVSIEYEVSADGYTGPALVAPYPNWSTVVQYGQAFTAPHTNDNFSTVDYKLENVILNGMTIPAAGFTDSSAPSFLLMATYVWSQDLSIKYALNVDDFTVFFDCTEGICENGLGFTGNKFDRKGVPVGGLVGDCLDDAPPASWMKRAGYDFVGWYTDPSCADGTEFDLAKDRVYKTLTLYAGWQIKQYDVTYYYNYDGTGQPKSDEVYHEEKVTFGEPVPMPAPPTRAGYRFNDWRITWYDTLLGQQYAYWDPNTIMPDYDINIFAEWTQIDYRLTYKFPDGEGATYSVTGYHYGDKLLPYPAAQEVPGKKFIGWFYDAGRTWQWNEDDQINDSIIGPNDEITLYALFDTVRLTAVELDHWNITGGNGAFKTTVDLRDISVKNLVFEIENLPYVPVSADLETTISVNGVDHGYWGGNIQLIPGEDDRYQYAVPLSMMAAHNDVVILTVRDRGFPIGTFTVTYKMYIVSFNTNGAAPITTTLNYEYAQEFGPMPFADPTLAGYAFGGWYDVTTDPDTLYVSTTPVKKDVELVAAWYKLALTGVDFLDQADVIPFPDNVFGAEVVSETPPATFDREAKFTIPNVAGNDITVDFQEDGHKVFGSYLDAAGNDIYVLRDPLGSGSYQNGTLLTYIVYADGIEIGRFEVTVKIPVTLLSIEGFSSDNGACNKGVLSPTPVGPQNTAYSLVPPPYLYTLRETYGIQVKHTTAVPGAITAVVTDIYGNLLISDPLKPIAGSSPTDSTFKHASIDLKYGPVVYHIYNGSEEIASIAVKPRFIVTFDVARNGGADWTPGARYPAYGDTVNLPNLTKTGHTFVAWWYDADPDPDVEDWKEWKPTDTVTSDLVLYASWTPNPVVVIFNADGGTFDPSNPQNPNTVLTDEIEVEIPYGSAVPAANVPEPEKGVNWVFTGWRAYKTDGMTYIGLWDPTVDIVDYVSGVSLYANWEEIKYTVTFVDYDGTVLDVRADRPYNDTIITPPSSPAMSGWTFNGWWYVDPTGPSNMLKWEFGATGTRITDNITVTAGYLQDFTVIFTDNGAPIPGLPSRIVTDGSKTAKPSVAWLNTLKSHYTFNEWWYDPVGDGDPNDFVIWDFDDPVTGNMTLMASWIPNTYTVKFVDSDLLTKLADDQTIVYGLSNDGVNNDGKAIKPTPNPTAYGWIFKEWLDAWDNVWDFDTQVADNTTLYANWVRDTFKVTFDDGFGTTTGTLTLPYEDWFNFAATPWLVLDDPDYYPGHTFGGWYKDTACQDPWQYGGVDKVTKDVTLFAKWTVNEYKVTFWPNYPKAPDLSPGDIGGVPANITDVPYQTKIADPGDAYDATEKYVFTGWYKEAACDNLWDFGVDEVEENISLFAGWVRIYKVLYDANHTLAVGPVPIDNDEYEKDDLVPVLAPSPSLVLTGHPEYEISGWRYGNPTGTLYNAGEEFPMPASNVTMYAEWTLKKYTVTFVGNGATTLDPDEATVEHGNPVPWPTASRTGFIPGGWYYDNVTFANRYEGEPITESITLYAKWIPVPEVDFLVNLFPTAGTTAVTGENEYTITLSADAQLLNPITLTMPSGYTPTGTEQAELIAPLLPPGLDVVLTPVSGGFEISFEISSVPTNPILYLIDLPVEIVISDGLVQIAKLIFVA